MANEISALGLVDMIRGILRCCLYCMLHIIGSFVLYMGPKTLTKFNSKFQSQHLI